MASKEQISQLSDQKTYQTISLENALVSKDAITPLPFPTKYAQVETPSGNIPSYKIETVIRLGNRFIGLPFKAHWCYENSDNSALFVHDGDIYRIGINDTKYRKIYLDSPCNRLDGIASGDFNNDCGNDNVVKQFTFTYVDCYGNESYPAPFLVINTKSNESITLCDNNLVPDNAVSRRLYEVFPDAGLSTTLMGIAEQPIGDRTFIVKPGSTYQGEFYKYSIDDVVYLPIRPNGIANYGSNSYVIWDDHDIYFSMPGDINVYSADNIVHIPNRIRFIVSSSGLKTKRSSLFFDPSSVSYWNTIAVADRYAYRLHNYKNNVQVTEMMHFDKLINNYSYGHSPSNILFLTDKNAYGFVADTDLSLSKIPIDLKNDDLEDAEITGDDERIYIKSYNAVNGNYISAINVSTGEVAVYSLSPQKLVIAQDDSLLLMNEDGTLYTLQYKGLYNTLKWRFKINKGQSRYHKSIRFLTDKFRNRDMDDCGDIILNVSLYDYDYKVSSWCVKNNKAIKLPILNMDYPVIEVKSNIPLYGVELL